MEEIIRNKDGFIIDMDGVLYHGNNILQGALEFVDWLKDNDKKYLFLTNSSERSPRELSQKLGRLGINVEEEHFYTSAIATAIFLASQSPKCSAYIIGEPGLINALYDVGITMNDVSPEYVIIGETRSYSFEKIEKAVQLVQKGAKLIGTNPDRTGPTEKGIMPATGALAVPIEIATNKKAYYIGKPNPLMMRHALKKLGTDVRNTIIIGDRMDTDIVAGIESEIDTILVLSGVTNQINIHNFSYMPKYIYSNVGEVIK
ncbi:MAG TPA: HAD-IIA family hydrolase [Clostridia bacterium]|jgi:NagD protein|nr:MAG: Ribonucleotide monophosphatase NagD [Firmicutes bacterium ADurb.Bin146]HOD92546.1 HAD-IIA family hydrolase [Clostridia bacterium]HQM39204.1 HAD-IIA family hydrolase [Clostridia bacterium]